MNNFIIVVKSAVVAVGIGLMVYGFGWGHGGQMLLGFTMASLAVLSVWASGEGRK